MACQAGTASIIGERRPIFNVNAQAEIESYEQTQVCFGIFGVRLMGFQSSLCENDMWPDFGQP